MSLPMLSLAQTKKSTKQLEQQVQKAKEQAAAAQKAEDEAAAKKQPYTQLGASLLPLKIVTPGGTMITQHDLPENQPVLLVLFNPMCDHCLKSATDIQQHISSFKDVTVVYITGMNLIDKIKEFITSSGSVESKNFVFGGVDKEMSNQIFISKGIPQFMMYNKDRILQHIDFETLDIEATLKYLKK
ncbi:hypothetical protein EMGBS15_12390 [Filimonas sp.]|jgi:hypothetical protein|nr:hypothetical protein EMGBS15_12390 [Filimonas sp.]